MKVYGIRYVRTPLFVISLSLARHVYSLWQREPIFIAEIILNFDSTPHRGDGANANFLHAVGERWFLFKTGENYRAGYVEWRIEWPKRGSNCKKNCRAIISRAYTSCIIRSSIAHGSLTDI